MPFDNLINKLINQVNKFSIAKITKDKVELVISDGFFTKYKNNKVYLHYCLDIDLDEFIKCFIHELRHVQQYILYYEYYKKKLAIIDIHNDVLSWEKLYVGIEQYNELSCSVEFDAYAFIFLFFEVYEEYNKKFDINKIQIPKIKDIYFKMKENYEKIKKG